MKMLVTLSLLLVAVGCNSQHSQQLNPFTAYGTQRLPPPGTQSMGQPATTQPYYQGPAANQAPSLNPGYQGGSYQGQQPAQFAPPPTATPAGGWQGVNNTSASGGVVQASYASETNSTATPSAATTSTATSSASTSTANVTPSITGDSGSSSDNPYLKGMRVNEVTEVTETTQPLAPPTTANVPGNNWAAPAPLPSPASTMQAIPKPSRIP